METRLASLFTATALLGCGNSVQVGDRSVPETDEVPEIPRSENPTNAERLELVATGDSRRWRITGESLDGGAPLRSLTGHSAFWFAWSVFHPASEIYLGPDLGGTPVAVDQGPCTVPCDEILPACSGRDCIPSLQSPRMVPADSEELDYLLDGDEVLGVVTAEGPRAYPHNILWWHEIVNETIAGEAYSVTLCPLTGSGLAFDRSGFVEDQTVELGVSGNLYNSNLTMYDRETGTWWSQMRLEGVSGPSKGKPAPLIPVFEMTWRAWRSLYPNTLVVSRATGHARNYRQYPYGGYRTDPVNTFRVTNPLPDHRFGIKDMVFGLFVGASKRAYRWRDLAVAEGSRQGVIGDELGEVSVALVFDIDARYVHAFERRLDGEVLDLELVINP